MFQAYDCTQPRNIRDSSFNVLNNCNSPPTLIDHTNITFQLLQKEKYTRFQGYSCSLEVTRDVRYCGVYDHETTFPEFGYDNRPEPLTVAQCQDYVHDKKLTINGIDHELNVNGVTLVHMETVGRTYVQDGEVRCEGETFSYQRTKIDRAIVFDQWKLTIKPEEFIADEEGDVTAYQAQIKLACGVTESGCRTDLITFTWTKPEDQCPMAVTRQVSGLELLTDKGEHVIMSTDGSLIRLVKGTSLSLCGRVVYATNYPRLFMYPMPGTQPFPRSIHPSEVSVITYVKNRDDFLYHFVMDKVQEELEKVIYDNCQRTHKDTQMMSWLQHTTPGLATFFLGNGTFASAAGEVLYTYQCQPVLVRAIAHQECYQSLPVTRVGSAPTTSIDEDGSEPLLFMEPITHRLSKRGITAPCAEKFMPKYQNAQGGWIVATPVIQSTSTPAQPSSSKQRTLQLHADIDWSKGGVYTEQELSDMESYLEFSRTREALSFQLARQAQNHYRFSGHIGPGQLFPESPVFKNWKSILWRKIVNFFHTWGETASVFVSIWILYRVVSMMTGWIYTFFALHNLYGCGKQLCLFPCSKFLLMRWYQASKLQEYENYGNIAKASAPPANGLKGDEPPQKKATVGTTFSKAGGCEVTGSLEYPVNALRNM